MQEETYADADVAAATRGGADATSGAMVNHVRPSPPACFFRFSVRWVGMAGWWQLGRSANITSDSCPGIPDTPPTRHRHKSDAGPAPRSLGCQQCLLMMG